MASIVSELDDHAAAALDRLTEREKECLRRWLQHQTAKEMAIDLGISPHAVEKRLKMARTKLDVSSSLDAARLLAAAEGYDLAVPQPPDLDIESAPRQTWLSRPRIFGALAMSISAAIILTIAAQSGSIDASHQPASAASDNSDIPQIVLAQASPEQVEDYVAERFAEFDKDRSGFVEEIEGPRSIQLACCGREPGEPLTGKAAWQEFLGQNADDGDNRVSYAEFRNVRYDRLLKNGIPIEREKVVVIGERRAAYAESKPGEKPRNFFPADMEYVKASEDRVRAYVRTMFDNWDKDGSGYVELAEAPIMIGTPKATMAPDGTVIYDRNDPLNELTGDEARAQYISSVDSDGDGKVSFDEYAGPVMPQYIERGIPLIPADWKNASAGSGSEG